MRHVMAQKSDEVRKKSLATEKNSVTRDFYFVATKKYSVAIEMICPLTTYSS